MSKLASLSVSLSVKLSLTLATLASAACLDAGPAAPPETAAVSAATATATASTEHTVPMRVLARRGSPTAVTARVAVASRKLDLSVTYTANGATAEVRDAGALRIRLTNDAAGGQRATNHLGQTYTIAQLKANRALAETFDASAMLLFDPEVLGLTTGVDPAKNPAGGVALGGAVFVGMCLSGSTIDYDSDSGWDVHIQWDCPGEWN